MFIPNIMIALAIFLAKILEISLSSIKLIFMMKKEKIMASVIASLECLVWALVVSGIITNLKDNPLWVIAYCGGYALGYYIGSLVEEKLAMGTVFIQFIVPKEDEETVKDKLKEKKCGLTCIDAKGSQSDVVIIMTIVPRKIASNITNDISSISHKSTFAITSDVSKTMGGIGLMK